MRNTYTINYFIKFINYSFVVEISLIKLMWHDLQDILHPKIEQEEDRIG